MATQIPIWLQTTDVVLDTLAAVSWPVAIGFALYGFRKPITDLLTRMRKFNSFGSEAEFHPVETSPTQRAEGKDNANLPISYHENLPALPPPDPVFDTLDEFAKTTLETHFPDSQSQQLAWAIRMRSISEANRIHESNYRLIYGSQIAALKALNLSGTAKADDFRPFFQRASDNPEWQPIYEGKTFADWGQFLVDAGYVALIENSDPELVRITPFGQQFLVWMTTARAGENKLG